ncbi:aminotransferase class V-fold PLP-dependent enzyme [Shimia thalassica]|uniref:aminotransferase class V-fold PLP-dependent enzyme n=1 Tax=Shimia thalassica TaxID=1715693 RepID=UPI002732BC6D|nr:aminotransferase class V-fold PLP-dependent enzyme [Shimia thalassica]MDP2582355.1 aminotransferase class V-fold PLP-dependent enzyme [Shimia thalassica]
MSLQHQSIASFEAHLRALPDPAAALSAGQIGKDMTIETPFGRKPLVYADYIASGRPLRQVEEFIMTDVLPYYANTHTSDSFCGAAMSTLREEARQVIAEKCGGTVEEHAVIFSGSGATSGLNQLVHLLGVKDAVAAGRPAFVITGPYEHHSNILPWRESGAEVIEIAEAADGGPDLELLDRELARCTAQGLTIAAFSAASNVTGICTDVPSVTKIVKSRGAAMVWDYAGGGPYLPVSMTQPDGSAIDAVVLSPHKFIGGPGASGVLIMRRDAARTQKPSRPGGGTVAFVNAHRHDYVKRLEQREEGGTPNVIGDIRAALALVVKDVLGQEYISARNAGNARKAFAVWGTVPGIEILASDKEDRLPFLSFVPRDAEGARMDYRVFTRALSDRFGIQARGGCSCAGPYVHHLMGIDDAHSDAIRDEILSGDTASKPGFVRLNLSYLMDDATIDYILNAVIELVQLEVAEAA